MRDSEDVGEIISRLSALEGRLKARESELEYWTKDHGLHLICSHTTNIDNKIPLSAKSQKEEADMLIEMKGISVDSKPRKDGLCHARWTDDERQQHSVYAHSKEEAIQKALKAKQDAHNAPKSTKALTVGAWLDKWFITYHAPNVSKDYADTNKSYIDRIPTYIKSLNVNKVTTLMLQEYLLTIPQDNTRYKIKTLLASAAKKAYADGIVKHNPCDALEIKRGHYEHYDPIDLPLQDKVMEAITEPKYKRLWWLCCCTGLRISEAMGILYKDLTPDGLYVTKQLLRSGEEKDNTKTTAGVRVVPILQELWTVIGNGKPSKRVFEGLTYSGAKNYFEGLYKKLKLKIVPCHSTRHTFISNCYAAKIPEKYVQEWAGHAKLDTTLDVYTHIYTSGTSKLLDYILKLKEEFTLNLH